MGFSYLGDQDTSPGNYWDSFLGPSRSPGSVLIIFLIIIIIVTAGILSAEDMALLYYVRYRGSGHKSSGIK